MFFKIPDHKRVCIYKDGQRIMNIKEGSWIGHAEYLNHIGILDLDSIQPGASSIRSREKKMPVSKKSSFKASKIIWHITCKIESVQQEAQEVNLNDNEEEDEEEETLSGASEDYDRNSVILFKWDFKRMTTLFEDEEHGRNFKNGIFSLWLKSVSDYILNQSMEILEYKVKEDEIKEAIRRNTVHMNEPIDYESLKAGIVESSSSESDNEVHLSSSSNEFDEAKLEEINDPYFQKCQTEVAHAEPIEAKKSKTKEDKSTKKPKKMYGQLKKFTKSSEAEQPVSTRVLCPLAHCFYRLGFKYINLKSAKSLEKNRQSLMMQSRSKGQLRCFQRRKCRRCALMCLEICRQMPPILRQEIRKS